MTITTTLPLKVGANTYGVRVFKPSHMLDEREPVLTPSLGEYRVYDDVAYSMMTADLVRNRHYEDAIRKRAAGRIALDIGTGRDVNWAHACIRAGARKVYAIEELDESFRGAQATIARLGLGDRITLIRGNATTVELPERVDLCVSEIIGSIGSAEGAPAVLHDARRRHMTKDGIMIPERCAARVAAIQLPDAVHREPTLTYGAATYLQRIFAQTGFPFDIKLCIANLPASSMLSTDDMFEDFDFTGDVPVRSVQHAKLRILRHGRADALLIWNLLWCLNEDPPLDGLQGQGVFSDLVFLPIFHPGTEVSENDVIEMTCEASPSDDGVLPDYRIEGVIRSSGKERQFSYEAAHHKQLFRANPFYQSLFT
jgi:hypothetical protein